MNKFLLGTTALIAAAAMSAEAGAAEKIKLSVSGYGNFAAAYVDQSQSPAAAESLRDYGFAQETEVHFKGSTTLDNGIKVGFRAELELDRDNAGTDEDGDGSTSNDIIDEVYFHVDTGFGQFQFGSQDGVADQFGVFSPIIAQGHRLNDAEIYFFQDPDSGDELFRPVVMRTDVSTSDDSLKLIYITPRLAGFQLGVSFMPEFTKGYTGFSSRADAEGDQQENIWEIGANYSGEFDAVSLAAYVAYMTGSNESSAVGDDDLEEWGAGARIGFDLGEGTLSFGGSYRESNTNNFSITTADDRDETTVWELGAQYATGPWKFGANYIDGDVEGTSGIVTSEGSGWQAEAGYELSQGIVMVLGYQNLEYERTDGGSYAEFGTVDADADVVFLEMDLSM